MFKKDRKSKAIYLLTIIVIAASITWAASKHLAVSLIPHHQELNAFQESQAYNDFLKTILAAFAAIGAAIGLIYTALRHQLDKDSDATSRYTTAIEQLASDEESIRIGGIYALERVAQDSSRDSQTILNVLCAWLCGSDSEKGVADKQAAVTVVCRYSNHFPERKIDLRSAVLDDMIFEKGLLEGANLQGASLKNTDFRRANLNKAYLKDANLNYSKLRRASMEGCILYNAKLYEASMERANLSGAKLKGANLQAAHLDNAILKKANLDRALLYGSHLEMTNLQGASLVNAKTKGAVFTGTIMDGANIKSAKIKKDSLSKEQIERSIGSPDWVTDDRTKP